MKSVRSFFFAFAVLFLAASTQAQQTGVKANIPFDFVVNNHTYPAGEYTLKGVSVDSPMLRIDNAQGDASVVSLTIPCNRPWPADSTKLVFHRVGDTYFLSQLWIEGYNYGRSFSEGHQEVLLAKNHHQENVTINGSMAR